MVRSPAVNPHMQGEDAIAFDDIDFEDVPFGPLPESGAVDLGPAYRATSALLRDVLLASRSGRLDQATASQMTGGAVARAARGEPDIQIVAWAGRFAARRGYTWRAPRVSA
jgi:hypothetical protein